MKFLFCGDIVGRSGREVIVKILRDLKEDHAIDLVIANGENAAHGFGITPSIAHELFAAGVDILTLGNHSFDNKDALSIIDQNPKIIRPLNYPAYVPGRGYTFWTSPQGQKVLIINVLGRLFMEPSNDPFEAIDSLLEKFPLGGNIHSIVVDIHGEASSEKMALAQYLDGRVSAVIGTHTHTPTADAQILLKGTGYQTDAGMCGDFQSVIGMDKTVPIERFLKKISVSRMTPASGEGTFCGVYFETNDKGMLTHIQNVIIGPRLKNCTIQVYS